MIPFAHFTETTASDYYWLALYGLVNVGLGFSIYLLGAKRVSALTAALVGLLEVPIALIWASILFNEQVTKITIVGGGLICISTVIYLVKPNGPSPQPS